MEKSARRILITCIIIAICTAAGIYLLREKPHERRSIEIKVADESLRYFDKMIWRENNFRKTMKNKEQTMSRLIEKFNQKYKVKSETLKVDFEEKERATVLRCVIRGKIQKSRDNYRADFSWFLDPLGLDFIDNDFNESKTSLSWSGKVNNISTTITIDLPTQESVYRALGGSVGHCHKHIWWPA